MYSSFVLPLFLEPVKAGFPSPASDYAEGSLDLNEFLIRDRVSTFYVRVAGDSMIGAGIFSKDILMVDRGLQAKHGDIVVAAVQGEFTVKRIFFKERDRVILHPENELYPDMELDCRDELTLFGVVTAVVRKLKP
ncbi:MAG: translesion error-prone DNA polymerase V autoproteolytic subunit [Spirochaetaceae bacterium]|jgi:DNA polymerase V|nr:translesion error-prone DNA polymerase V autoproteolytic subunit [Spirochaetaceae bacterium]